MKTVLSRYSARWVQPATVIALLLSACGGSTDNDDPANGGAAGAGAAGAGGGSAGDCFYAGKTYKNGASFPAADGCNDCSCNDGTVGCTLKGCVTGCDYEGKHYNPGQSFPADDGCNKCTCNPSGAVICTELDCAPVACMYEGKPYNVGESFPSVDGCNTCTCETPTVVSCSTKACTCDPAKEWWKKYVATNPGECAVIDFACPQFTKGFENQCGCGCEQDANCPPSINCMPPADCTELVKKCPYSSVAY